MDRAMNQDEVVSLLELDKVRRIVSRFCQTPLGAAAVEAARFRCDRDWVKDEQAVTWEMRDALAGGFELDLTGVEALEVILPRLQVVNRSLAPAEFLTMVRNAEAGRRILDGLAGLSGRCPRLAVESEALPDLSDLIRAVRKVINRKGELVDNASPELARIRRSLKSLRGEIVKRLERLTGEKDLSHVLQEDYITLRDDRYVVLIKSEHKNAVPGIVHGRSSTEATFYVEPFQTVEVNNRLIMAREEERAESARILLALTHQIRERREELSLLVEGLSRFDFLAGKARFAEAAGSARPRIASAGEEFKLVAARHPLLDERLARQRSDAGLTSGLAGSSPVDRVVPLDLVLDEGARSMVITGPNAGGKTVALKTAGLAVLMLQSGLPPVVGEGSAFPLFAAVAAHIGDRQDIIANLSTFTARLAGIGRIISDLQPPSLVLLDEVGSGTDPAEGAALAMAILDHFHARGSWTLATTHHQALKSYAFATDGVLNGSMSFDEQTLTPSFTLIPGVPGSSNAFRVAETVGFPGEIIEQARAYLGDQDRRVEQMVAQLEETLARARREEESMKADRDRLQRLVGEKEREQQAFIERENRYLATRMEEAEKVLARFSRKVEELVAGLKDRAVAEKVRAAANRERKRLAATVSETRGALTPTRGEEAAPIRILEPGERVKLRHTSLRGTVISDDPERGEAVLTVEGKRMTVFRENLIAGGEPVVAGTEEGEKKGGFTIGEAAQIVLEGRGDAMGGNELKVIGQRVDEALPRVDKFLDDATLSGLNTVRIIHGHGTGALRRAVAGLLDGHPHVAGFRAAAQQEGGSAVTVVQLKD
jgi:DNA mismatch repair protein MutS2